MHTDFPVDIFLKPTLQIGHLIYLHIFSYMIEIEWKYRKIMIDK